MDPPCVSRRKKSDAPHTKIPFSALVQLAKLQQLLLSVRFIGIYVGGHSIRSGRRNHNIRPCGKSPVFHLLSPDIYGLGSKCDLLNPHLKPGEISNFAA